MSALRHLTFALAAWLLCGHACAAALDTLDGCAAQAPTQAKGIEALQAACPGLESALRELGFVAMLPDDWRSTLTRHGLADLDELAHHYAATPARTRPDPGAMHGVLDQLAQEQVHPPRSWWSAFTDWLRGWLGSHDADSSSWFNRLLNHISASASLIKAVTYVLLFVTVAAALAFIFNELGIAGVLSPRARADGQSGTAALPRREPGAQGAVNLDDVAPRDRPRLLLRLLVARLLANGQLRADRSLTHRELVRDSAFDDAESRARFARVTELAEQVLYGSGEAASPQAGAVIADGRDLLRQLQPREAGPA